MEETRPVDHFFVYIVESPSPIDIYHGRSEGARLVETLKLDSIACVSRTAINGTAFVAALKIGLAEEMEQFPGRIPFIHLSAHGSDDGIQLSSGEIVSWDTLREQLMPINQSLGGHLVLCMSACKGYSACRMAMREGDEPHPYNVVVATGDSPTWSDTAISYLVFYHLIGKGKTLDEVMQVMKGVSGVDWFWESTENHKKVYLDVIASSAAARVSLL